MTRPRRQAGYSLLEVLVAFAIAAAALSVIFGSAARAVSASAHSHDLASAATLASSLYADAGANVSATPVRDGIYGTRFKWQISMRPYAAAQSDEMRTRFGLYDVRIEVTWTERGRPHTYSLSGLKPAAGETR